MDSFAEVPIQSESERQQFDVMVRAFEIFRERSIVRGDLWAKFTSLDAFQNMESKMARIQHGRQRLEEIDDLHKDHHVLLESVVDDALDLINYATFLIRHLEGSKPNV
jgi:hypothetical protein